MKLTTMIEITADQIGISATTVTSIAHNLRAVGLLTSKGRGAGGAEMVARDFANLFLASCGVGLVAKAAFELIEWRQRAPDLFDYIERRVESGPTDEDVALEFDVDMYCARKVGKSRTQTFGSRPDVPSYLTRTVTPAAFRNWIERVRG